MHIYDYICDSRVFYTGSKSQRLAWIYRLSTNVWLTSSIAENKILFESHYFSICLPIVAKYKFVNKVTFEWSLTKVYYFKCSANILNENFFSKYTFNEMRELLPILRALWIWTGRKPLPKQSQKPSPRHKRVFIELHTNSQSTPVSHKDKQRS